MNGFMRAAAVLASGAVLLAGSPTSAAGPAPDDAQAGNERKTVEELKLENAWVDPKAPLQFGAEPLGSVETAAATAAANATCAIGADEATALVVAMTWPEVSPSGEPPSPMTLSRYDTQPELGDPEGRAEGLWFHPGIGMWQLDSAGLGTEFTAGEAMDSTYAADQMAPFIVNKYCDAVNGGAAAADARADAWTDWVACGEGACEDTFQRVLSEGITPVEGVGRYGGAEVRECELGGVALDCVFVDVANAQGASWWAVPDGGQSPVAAPFYVLRVDDAGTTTEVRYWLAEDSGASEDVQASRPFGGNARDSLTWSTGTGLCDITTGSGTC